jgi:hypothetical protein
MTVGLVGIASKELVTSDGADAVHRDQDDSEDSEFAKKLYDRRAILMCSKCADDFLASKNSA